MSIGSLYSFAPTWLPSLIAYYRCDLGVTASAGVVSQWNDQSGNAKNLTVQSTKTGPTNNTNTLNGLPVLTQAAANTNTLITPATMTFTAAMTWYWVVRNNNSVFCQAFDLNSNDARVAANATTNNIDTRVGSTIASGSITSGTWMIGTSLIPGGSSTITQRINGAANGTVSATRGVTAASSVNLWIGGDNGTSNNWVGDYAAFLFYNALHTTDQAVAVENYLNSIFAVF